MEKKILEVNVDDLNMGGVYGLVKNVIINNENRNIQIDIASIEHFANRANIDMFNSIGTHVFYVGYEGNKLLKQIKCFLNLRKLIKKGNYEYIHIHADVANKLFTSGLAAKSVGVKKVILHSHAAGVDGEHRKLKKCLHILCRRFLKYIATDYVACSDVAGQWMFPNVDSKKVYLINNGVDLEKFRFNELTRNRIRKDLKLEDEILIGHVGRFCFQKNHDYFLNILEILKKKKIPSKLLLIGEGPDEHMFKEKLKQYQLENEVIFWGVSNKVQELFMAMDVFVLPSHFEGLPIVGVEAQATGLPVIFSNKITTSAKLTDNVSFLGIEAKDAAKWVDTIVCYKNKAINRKQAYFLLKEKNFSIQDTVNRFLKLYKG